MGTALILGSGSHFSPPAAHNLRQDPSRIITDIARNTREPCLEHQDADAVGVKSPSTRSDPLLIASSPASNDDIALDRKR
jgi:hypothetical protein